MAVLVKTLNGLAYASVKTRNSLAVASAKTINGLDVTAGALSAITSRSGGTLRNDFTANPGLGMYFTVGASDITVTHLGRWIVAGNSGTHTISLINAGITTERSVSIDTSGKTPGEFYYEPITPNLLFSGASYYCLSSELSGGDQWYDLDQSCAFSPGITFIGGRYISGGAPSGGSDPPWVPPNFLYTI
jgi:hypothetical protein